MARHRPLVPPLLEAVDPVPAGPPSRQPPVPDLGELELPELERLLADSGARSFHARQLYRWIHRRGVTDLAQMTDLSKSLRLRLATTTRIVAPRLADRAVASDGTVKYRVALQDGRAVEAVFIPDTPAQTFCVSTQVGCAMQCAFCLTGRMGLVRNLSAGEIAGQVRLLAAAHQLVGRRFNVVLMGMGEPLHNYDHTMKALRMLAAEAGLAVSPQRVTLSTVGLVPALERLADEPLMPNVAISLHGTTDAQRQRLVPAARRYSLADVLAACRRLPLRRRSRITFEYVLLAHVNDAEDDARRLARLLSGLPAKVNLIPLNEAPEIPFARPSEARIDRFARIVADHHVRVSVRKSRGRDIRAACGQLIIEGALRSPAQEIAQRMTGVTG